MNRLVLYELPIYSISETDFEKERELFIEEYINKTGRTAKDANTIFCLENTNGIWRYNHIFGYVCIEITKTDIVLELFKMDYQRLPLIRKFPNRTIKHSYKNGYHFRYKNSNKQEILEKIDKYLDAIIKDFLPKGSVIDNSQLKNTFKYIDIELIQNDLDKD